MNAWFWRADRGDEARTVLGKGLSTTEDTKKCAIETKSKWEDGTWSVVFARPLAVPEQKEEAVQLAPGKLSGGADRRSSVSIDPKAGKKGTLPP